MTRERIRDYIIDRLVGRGGMANVYLATHIHLETKAALKILHEQYSDDPRFRARFLNEAKTLHKLHHPNIVEQKEFFEENTKLILVMEFIAGRGLDQVIGKEVGPIPHQKALPLFKQILEGIRYAHTMGVIHRDIKPENILLSSNDVVKISDFGIAKLADISGGTRTGAHLGTLRYMSPEQVKCSKSIDKRTDIYSLGITLYEMLSGRVPFHDDTDSSGYETMNSILKKEIPDPRNYYPDIPEWLVVIVKKATAKSPADRYQTCDEFIEAIEISKKNAAIKIKKLAKKPESIVMSKPNSAKKSVAGNTRKVGKLTESKNQQSKPPDYRNSPLAEQSSGIVAQRLLKSPRKKSKKWLWFLPVALIFSIFIILKITGNEEPVPVLFEEDSCSQLISESTISYDAPESVTTEPIAGSVSSGPLSDMKFVTIPSGTFMMGSSPSEAGRYDNEGPRHSVSISSFELMTTEITQGMWEAVMGTDVRYYRDLANPDLPLFGEGSNYPMYYVSWNDCQEFIEKLNELDTSHTYRLPSESEWEYACRAGTTTRFYWGDSDSEGVMGDFCWYSSNSNLSTHPVATKLPNNWRLYNMSGNIWEWCEDTWHSSYDGAPSDGSAWVSSGVSSCVFRGCNLFERSCRSAFRLSCIADGRFKNLGFRLARLVR